MVQEDYLHCGAYENHAPHPEAGFTAFQQAETGLYFFAMMDADGKTLLKSEGYPQIAARENGIHSVIKNRVNEAFYSVKQENGKYFLSLRAANFKEIARSCDVDTEAEALALMPYVMGQKIRMSKVETTVVEAPKEREVNKVDDDYLACKEYNDQTHHVSNQVHPQHADFTNFTHESNGFHYFAWVDADGKTLMRSEGYPQIAARDNGLNSVLNNRETEERFSIVERAGHYFVILKAGNHQEIARSCPFNTREEALALFPSERKNRSLALAEAASLAAAARLTEENRMKIDEENRIRAADLARIDEENRLKQEEQTRLNLEEENRRRAEAKIAEDTRMKAAEVAAAAAAAARLAEENRIRTEKETARKAEELRLAEEKRVRLAAEDRRKAELAAAAALAASVAAAKKAEVKRPVVEERKAEIIPPAAYVEDTKPGFNWWWLLLPLLLLLAWFLWRSCNKEVVATAPIVAPVIADTTKVTAPVPTVAPVPVVTAKAELKWLFFDYDKSNLRGASTTELDKLVSILKAHPDYTAEMAAFTDDHGTDAYNDALSQRRADAAKAYLVKKGITENRIKASTHGKKEPAAKNEVNGKDSEKGRQFNRRVELNVDDAQGNRVITSIQPDIDPTLKE